MKKFIFSVFLVIALSVSSFSFVHAISPELAISAASFAGRVLEVYLDKSSSSAEKEAALSGYKDRWISTLSGANGYVDVSYDSLSNALFSLTESSQPAKIVYSSSAGGYVIQASGPFGYHSYSGSSGFGANYVWNNTGYYLTNTQRVVFRALFNTDSLLSSISSTLSSKLTTLSDGVSNIYTKLSSIDDSVVIGLGTLSNIYNYLNGDLTTYLQSIDSSVVGSESFLGQISTKMDSVVDTLTTESGKNSLFFPITQRLSTIIDRIVPAYSHPFANRGWSLSGNDLSSLSVSDVGYTALSSMMETVTEEYLSYPFFSGAYHIDVLDSLSIVHSTVGANTGYFIRGTGTLSKSVNGINEFYEDQTFYLGDSDSTLFYASDSSSVFFDTSGLENALSNINDNITRLFGEYDSTYEFPLIPTSFSSNVTVSGAKSSLFASVSNSPDLYYCSNPRLRFYRFSSIPSGDSPLGSLCICNPDGVNAFTYFEDLSSNPVPSGTVLCRNFKLRYFDNFVHTFSNVPFTVSVSGDSCYIDGTIAPKWDSSGSWLGWYLNNKFITTDSEPSFPVLSSPPASGDYYIYSTSSSPVPVVYSTRFTGFLQSQFVLLQNAIGSIGGSDLSGVTTRLDSILGKLDSSSGSDLTTLESTVANIESTLSIINGKLDNTATSIENTTVNITNNNPAYNVFYVTDENGEEHSITSVAADSLSASGKLLQFLYKLVVDGALSGVDSSVDGLNDFFFDSAPSSIVEGVTVWD